MLCDKCGKNNATVFVKQMINNQETTQHLCEQCASEVMDIGNFSLDKFFNGEHFGSFFENPFGARVEQLPKCPVCGMTYADFCNTGKLGCSECYSAFAAKLLPMVKSIHGKDLHMGKVKNGQCSGCGSQVVAAPGGENDAKFYEKLALQKQLQDLVKAEKFEEAAKVRDQIKALEAELSKQSDQAAEAAEGEATKDETQKQ